MRRLPTLALFATLFFAACNKSDNTTPTPTPSTTGWRWKINGTGTEYVADSAYFTTQYKTFFAGGDTAMKHFFEVNLKGTTPGTYSLSDSGNAFYYSNKNGRTVPGSGSVIVTANTNGKISGSFSTSDTGNVFNMKSITGTFTDITVR